MHFKTSTYSNITMQSSAQHCIIKILVNPNAERCFSLRFKLAKKNHVNVKIVLNNPSELHLVIDEMVDTLKTRFNFVVNFNWKNTPAVIQNDARARERLLRLFQTGLEKKESPLHIPTSQEIDRLVQVAKLHMANGSVPDFHNVLTEKGRKKIHNYLVSHLAMPNMTMDMALAIAERLV